MIETNLAREKPNICQQTDRVALSGAGLQIWVRTPGRDPAHQYASILTSNSLTTLTSILSASILFTCFLQVWGHSAHPVSYTHLTLPTKA